MKVCATLSPSRVSWMAWNINDLYTVQKKAFEEAQCIRFIRPRKCTWPSPLFLISPPSSHGTDTMRSFKEATLIPVRN